MNNMNKQDLDDNKKGRIKIKIFYLILFVLVVSGITFALQLSSLSLAIDTAIVKIDEEVYGETSLDTSNLDLIPILDSEVETNTDNVLKIDFIVGGGIENNREDIIYDIALVDLQVDCNLLSEYVKWKLVKNGEVLSNGSLSYTFDTIKDGRFVLTEIQQDLPLYNDKQEWYEKYSFYLWISDPCQDDLAVCYANKNIVDTSNLMGKVLSGAIEVELYTDSKKELVRKPSAAIDGSMCFDSNT